MYFEMAAQDIRALPKLEGTVHVNMALIIKFMANYFFNPDEFPDIGPRNGLEDDRFLFNQGPTRGLGKIRFHDFNIAYSRVDLANMDVFKDQIKVLQDFLMAAPPDKEQQHDIDFLLILGELFTLVAYGQLIIENANIHQIEDELIVQIFDFMIRDFSKFALQLYSKTSSTKIQMALCLKMIKKPVKNPERFNKIWSKYIAPLNNAYAMNP
jgi:acyl-CoA dehydrogenase